MHFCDEEDRFHKFRLEPAKRTNPDIQFGEKIHNRQQSNFLSLKVYAKGTIFKILKKIGWKLLEKKLREELKFDQSRKLFQRYIFELETLSHSIVIFTAIKARRETKLMCFVQGVSKKIL